MRHTVFIVGPNVTYETDRRRAHLKLLQPVGQEDWEFTNAVDVKSALREVKFCLFTVSRKGVLFYATQSFIDTVSALTPTVVKEESWE